jgi:membrane-bound lytic murein transglycosylase D
MSVNTLARLNGMRTGDTLRTGQKLVLNTRGSSGRRSVANGGHSVSYKVRSGDTLSRIARVFGVRVSDLVNWNGISKHAVLRVGQRLTVNARGR